MVNIGNAKKKKKKRYEIYTLCLKKDDVVWNNKIIIDKKQRYIDFSIVSSISENYFYFFYFFLCFCCVFLYICQETRLVSSDSFQKNLCY